MPQFSIRTAAVLVAVTVAAITFGTTSAFAAAANPQSALTSVSCATADNCSAVTTFDNAIGEGEGLLLTESAGVWKPGVEAALPQDAAANPMSPGNFFGYGLTKIACSAPGDCSAIGSYLNTTNGLQSLFITQSGGHWKAGVAAKFPGNAATRGYDEYSDIDSLACTSAGNCTAVGYYAVKTGNLEPAIFTESGGKWHTGIELKLPANATGYGQEAGLLALSCPAAGSCIAVGSYTDNAQGGLALIATETSGKWTASQAALPGNAGVAGDGSAELDAIACPDSGDCVAGGNYIDQNYDSQALLVTRSGGAWKPGVEVTLPASPEPAQDAADEFAGVSQVQCPTVGNCTATGSYSDTQKDSQGLLLNEDGGAWSASSAQLPAPSATGVASQEVDFSDLSCVSAGNCVATGTFDYGDSHETTVGLLEEETDGTWSTSNSIPLPSNAGHEQTNASLAVSCLPGTSGGPSVDGADCAVVGGYTDGFGLFQGFASNGVGGVFSKASEAKLPGINHAELVNSLLAVLRKPTGKKGKPAAISKAHGVSYTFIAAERGKVTADWYAKVKGHRELIGKLSGSVLSAGRIKLKLKLTASGTKLLAASKKLKLTADATFKSHRGAKASLSTQFTLS